jgi:hypothetical protein
MLRFDLGPWQRCMLRVIRVTRAIRAIRVIKVIRVIMVIRVIRVIKVIWVIMVIKVIRAIRVYYDLGPWQHCRLRVISVIIGYIGSWQRWGVLSWVGSAGVYYRGLGSAIGFILSALLALLT